MARQFEDQDVTFLGVAWKGSEDEYRSFLERHDIGFIPHIRDDTGDVFASFGIRYQPGWVFIDDSGQHEVHPGALTQNELQAAVEELLDT